MKSFDEEKEEYMSKLYKPDKSRKGDVDNYIIPLIDYINKTENYFTTSSCSGRISLFTMHNSDNKYDAEWIFVSHDKINFDQILENLKELPSSLVRFKQEPMILHVCCRTLGDAQTLMYVAHEAGLKDSGIISTKKRFILKIVGSDRVDSPIAIDGKLVVDENYLKIITNLCNKKLEKVHQRIDRLYDLIKEKII